MLRVLLRGSVALVLERARELVGTLLLSSHLDRQGEDVRGTIKLRSEEGVVIEVAGKTPMR